MAVGITDPCAIGGSRYSLRQGFQLQ